MTKTTLAALLSFLIALSCTNGGRAQSADGATFKVGVTARHISPPEPYDWRGSMTRALSGVVWYPAEGGAAEKPQRFGPPSGPAIFEAAPAARDAKIAASPAKFPLVLLSHGTGGTVQSLAWLGTALAARGYIVAGVNHPGNNAIEPHTVQGFMLWWKRARDVSTLIDAMLADKEFGPRIDAQRIGAAGFSLGGYTVLVLAGGITSSWHFIESCRAAPTASCKSPPEFPDLAQKIEALIAADPVFADAIKNDSGSYRDARIRAVFAIAPALGPAMTNESLRAIAIPVAIVAGESDSIVPIEASARHYAAEIPHAGLTIFPGAVDHYTFLNVCTDAGRSAAPPICVDRPGVDRGAIHDATIDLATKFFGAQLGAH